MTFPLSTAGRGALVLAVTSWAVWACGEPSSESTPAPAQPAPAQPAATPATAEPAPVEAAKKPAAEAEPAAPEAAPEPSEPPKPTGEAIVVELWHDTVCPWCRIGHAQLDKAIAGFTERPVKIVYHPFLLDPDAPDEPQDFRERLGNKYGFENIEGMLRRVEDEGASAGIAFDFDKVEKTASSVRAHALLDWAPEDRKRKLLERLHEAYFLGKGDVNTVDGLVAIAKGLGLDADEARTAITDTKRLERIRAEARAAVDRGVRGVPFFQIGETQVTGAQPPHVLQAAMKNAANPAPAE